MRSLKEIHKNKLVHKETKRYVGYRLTSMGYDYLALRALVKRGVIDAVGRPLGVGKEADVFVVSASEQLLDDYPDLADTPHLAMKIHRLGRTSFRSVKSKRDYLVHRKSASWIYFSRLAAMKEYAFMCALHERGFPIPRPLGQSRHVVVMELCTGTLLTQVMELPDPVEAANHLLGIIVRLAQHGLVHCDLNEFNVIVDEEGNISVIDFPQMVSTSHVDAKMLFDRDVDGVRKFFHHRFAVSEDEMPQPDLDAIIRERDGEERLDTLVSASGFKNANQDGYYGIQDLGDEEELQDGFANIDMTSLQIALPAADSDTGENDSVSGVAANSSGRNASKETQSTSHGNAHADEELTNDEGDDSFSESSINKSLIEARVRKQRTNQKKRQQLSRRNTVKDSEKRKVKVEMDCGIWD